MDRCASPRAALLAIAVAVTAACNGRDTDLGASVSQVSADLHMHHVCPAGRLSSGELLERMAREDIQVGAVLVAAQNYDESVASFDGKDDPISSGGRILHADLEVSGFPAAGFGHVVLLGLGNIRFSPDPTTAPRSLGPIVDWGLAQGPRVVAGYAHGWAWPESGYPTPGVASISNCCLPLELPIDVTRGKISFLAEELNEKNAVSIGAHFDGGPLTMGTSILWRCLENMGYRLALVGGSDIICLNNTVGSPRTLALVDGPLSYDAYLDAVRRGRTAVAGQKHNRMDMRVDGARLGSEITLAGPSDLTIDIDSELEEAAPAQILVNGIAVRELALPAGPHLERTTIRAERSSWISARTRRVQTSAVYAILAGHPIRASADDACFMVRYVDHLRGLAAAQTRPEARLYLGTELDATLARYDAARAELMTRFRESGGIDCP